MRFAGRVALVTGAGSGIGRAAARLLAAEGARVALLDLDGDTAAGAAREIEALGAEALPLAGDIAAADQVAAALSRLAAAWGRLDAVFANAGINGITAPLDEIEPEEWDRVMAVNLRGTFLTLKYSIPLLRRQGGAVVINASGQGTRTFSVPGTTAYACSKAAVAALGKKLALELAAAHVRVNIVCPGSTDTGINRSKVSRGLERIQLPVVYPSGKVLLTGGRKAAPEQVARLVLFLLSDDADMITGSEVWIDGGMSLLQG